MRTWVRRGAPRKRRVVGVAVKLAAAFGIFGVIAAASTNDVIIAMATVLNSGLLLFTSILTQRNRKAIGDVQTTAEKTFQSTTHAANAAEGAARSAAISTIVASKHLGIDLRDSDIQALTENLESTIQSGRQARGESKG